MKKDAKKNNTSNNNIISEIKEEFKRQTTALMEHMTKEVKIVAEGHGILVKKIDNIESELSGVKNDINGLKNDVHGLKNDMAIIKPIVAANSKDLKEIRSELHFMNMALMETSHETKDHEKRIKKLEDKVLI
ncbi:MAG: hypothetical protein ABID09_02940 [Candidatus Omnitrophota bacterium]